MTKTYKSDAFAAIHETASDLHEIGLLSKQTMKRFDESCLTPVPKLTPEEIRAIREETHASQAVFARHLNVSPLVVSQWERGQRAPSGASLKLLALVKSKGLNCIA
ncbi:MAG: DNA-binding transcriptional regulator [Abitibacteriaceae bacterium]|nr:DNA-binding transcriptional regulator [Abditibacteriaceae bacterium]